MEGVPSPSFVFLLIFFAATQASSPYHEPSFICIAAPFIFSGFAIKFAFISAVFISSALLFGAVPLLLVQIFALTVLSVCTPQL